MAGGTRVLAAIHPWTIRLLRRTTYSAAAAARRSDSESRSAAASTAGACIRPGCRESRSSGPETETAARILPPGERTGADTEATPCSRSPTDCAQPRRRIPDSTAAENAAFSAAALSGIRRRGWAQSVGEREQGVASVSAPVRSPGGKILAAVSVSGPLERLSRQPGRMHAPAVLAAAERLSESLRRAAAAE